MLAMTYYCLYKYIHTRTRARTHTYTYTHATYYTNLCVCVCACVLSAKVFKEDMLGMFTRIPFVPPKLFDKLANSLIDWIARHLECALLEAYWSKQAEIMNPEEVEILNVANNLITVGTTEKVEGNEDAVIAIVNDNDDENVTEHRARKDDHPPGNGGDAVLFRQVRLFFVTGPSKERHAQQQRESTCSGVARACIRIRMHTCKAQLDMRTSRLHLERRANFCVVVVGTS